MGDAPACRRDRRRGRGARVGLPGRDRLSLHDARAVRRAGRQAQPVRLTAAAASPTAVARSGPRYVRNAGGDSDASVVPSCEPNRVTALVAGDNHAGVLCMNCTVACWGATTTASSARRRFIVHAAQRRYPPVARSRKKTAAASYSPSPPGTVSVPTRYRLPSQESNIGERRQLFRLCRDRQASKTKGIL